MDNTRLFLFIALSFIGLMLWDAWQRDYHSPETLTAPVANSANQQTPSTDELPNVAQPAQAVVANPETVVQDPTNINIASSLETSSNSNLIDVSTDLFDIKIDLRGGGISYAALKAYPRESTNPDVPFVFIAENSERLFIHQNGITGTGTTPDHRATYTSDAQSYSLRDGTQALNVVLKWQDESGLVVSKTYHFKANDYTIGISYKIQNNTQQVWAGRLYEQLQRAKPSSGRKLLYTFTGAAISTPEKLYEKYDYDDLEDAPINIDVTDGWIAILEHYFVTALVPAQTQKYHFYSKILDERRYIVGMYGDPKSIAAGSSDSFDTKLYIGPKRQDLLRALAPNLDRTVDYGVLWFIGEPLFKLLQFLHNLIGNWGWAIIVLTILLKLFFYPLSAAGYRSMAKMRKVQPRMMSIKERYGDDRARMNQAMMELYKEEKINPLGGCLPILVQIPVFIALYWVLLESVELRQVPFTLWLTDLTAKDPYFVLPLLMGISMWVQQKLNPAPMDPVQQKVMQVLPFVFTVFFAFFPAGLVLYWVVNNILSIIQQWRITKIIEQGK